MLSALDICLSIDRGVCISILEDLHWFTFYQLQYMSCYSLIQAPKDYCTLLIELLLNTALEWQQWIDTSTSFTVKVQV